MKRPSHPQTFLTGYIGGYCQISETFLVRGLYKRKNAFSVQKYIHYSALLIPCKNASLIKNRHLQPCVHVCFTVTAWDTRLDGISLTKEVEACFTTLCSCSLTLHLFASKCVRFLSYILQFLLFFSLFI